MYVCVCVYVHVHNIIFPLNCTMNPVNVFIEVLPYITLAVGLNSCYLLYGQNSICICMC